MLWRGGPGGRGKGQWGGHVCAGSYPTTGLRRGERLRTRLDLVGGQEAVQEVHRQAAGAQGEAVPARRLVWSTVRTPGRQAARTGLRRHQPRGRCPPGGTHQEDPLREARPYGRVHRRLALQVGAVHLHLPLAPQRRLQAGGLVAGGQLHVRQVALVGVRVVRVVAGPGGGGASRACILGFQPERRLQAVLRLRALQRVGAALGGRRGHGWGRARAPRGGGLWPRLPLRRSVYVPYTTVLRWGSTCTQSPPQVPRGQLVGAPGGLGDWQRPGSSPRSLRLRTALFWVTPHGRSPAAAWERAPRESAHRSAAQAAAHSDGAYSLRRVRIVIARYYRHRWPWRTGAPQLRSRSWRPPRS